MRITNSMMRNKLLSNLNLNLQRLDTYQRQMESQKRITRLSDDPVGVITAMQAKAKMGQLDRNLESIRDARTWTETVDSTYMDLQKIMADAYTTCVEMASDAKNPDDKKAGSEVIKQLMEHLVQTANSSVGNQYIFAGFETGEPPFEVNDNGELLYNGIQMHPAPDNAALDAEAENIIEFEIGYGLRTEVTFTGVKVMGVGEDNLYGKLEALYKDLAAGSDASVINQHITGLQDGQNRLLSHVAEVGGRENRLDMVENRYTSERLNYEDRLALVQDVDLAEAYINLSTAQSVYNAALQTGAKIIQPTLMDYIR